MSVDREDYIGRVDYQGDMILEPGEGMVRQLNELSASLARGSLNLMTSILVPGEYTLNPSAYLGTIFRHQLLVFERAKAIYRALGDPRIAYIGLGLNQEKIKIDIKRGKGKMIRIPDDETIVAILDSTPVGNRHLLLDLVFHSSILQQ